MSGNGMLAEKAKGESQDAKALNDLASSILQLRIKGDKDTDGTTVGRKAKHSPLVMTPGGSFVKAKGRTAHLSPGGEDDEDDEDEDMEIVLDPVIAAKGRAIAGGGGGAEGATSPSPIASTATPTLPPASRTTPLFGGAITVCLPSSFEDISAIRQVPDHQEVFADRFSEMSFIVELVDHNKEVSNVAAARYYFTDLAECNEAKTALLDSTAVVSEPSFLPCISDKSVVKCVLTGRQTVQKFNQPLAPLDSVQIVMVVVRLPRVGTDMLLSMNIPYSGQHCNLTVDAIRGKTAPAAPAPAGDVGAVFAAATSAEVAADADTEGKEGTSAEQAVPPSPAVSVMRAALASLTIHDWSLFA